MHTVLICASLESGTTTIVSTACSEGMGNAIVSAGFKIAGCLTQEKTTAIL